MTALVPSTVRFVAPPSESRCRCETCGRSLRREGAHGTPRGQRLLDDSGIAPEPPAHVIAQHAASLAHQRAVILNRRLADGWCFVWDRALLVARERKLGIEVERIDRDDTRAKPPHCAPWHAFFLRLDDAEDLAQSMPGHWQFAALYAEVVGAVQDFYESRGSAGPWWRFLASTSHHGRKWPARLRG